MRREPVSLEDRQTAVDQAQALAERLAMRWLEAKAAGQMERELEAALDDALRMLGRARRRLTETEKRR